MFDAKWSPVFDMFAATDSHGYLTMYGFGSDDRYKQIPREQFFHSDYRPLMHDLNGFAVDEQTQTAPHLMPPPFLVNADGNPYSSEYQRLVPGRENLNDAQLTPHTITNENGVAEIIGGPEQDEEERMEGQEYIHSNLTRFRNMWVKDLVRPLDSATLKTNQSTRLTKLDAEEDYFIVEYRKELEEMNNKNRNGGSSGGNYASGGRAGRPAKRVRNQNETAVRNRLNARALFDTDNEDNTNGFNGAGGHFRHPAG